MNAKIFRSFRELRDDLGRIDASFAYLALCLKHLETSAAESGDRVKFMNDVATRHSIRVHLLNDSDPQRNLYLSAAVAVHSEWDCFLSSFIDELVEFGYEKIDKGIRRDGESRLSFLIRAININVHDKLAGLPSTLINICEYMRLVRNYYAHKLNAPQRECVELFTKINQHIDPLPTKFGKLKLSSECCEIGFDDILIFTIAAKLLAEDICNRMVPKLDSLFEHKDTQAFIKREGNNISENSIRLFLFDRFGLDRKLADELCIKIRNKALV